MLYPNTKGREIASKALEWVGTPYVHQARVLGVGVDCVGLITCVAQSLGYSAYEDIRYWKMPQGDQITQELTKLFDPVSLDQPGDVLAFSWAGEPQHVGIRTCHGFVHADNSPGVRMVTEVALDRRWRRRLAGVYRWRL